MSSSPYCARGRDWERQYLKDMLSLSEFHFERCREYRQITNSFFPKQRSAKNLSDIPFVPSSLFKDLNLSSVPNSEIVKIMESSGTSGALSQIALDRSTSLKQAKLLAQIMKFWVGSERLPLLIVDSPAIVKGRGQNSARAAAVIGMMQFSSSHCWLLNEDGDYEIEATRAWLRSNDNRRVFVFGFTSLIWEKLVLGLPANTLNLRSGVLFHGGGWKKMQEKSVSRTAFRTALEHSTGVSEIHDYYGMVEQLGSIWVEVGDNVFVPSSQSHVVIRDPITLLPCEQGEVGLIQVFSLLPQSYPGHSVLTDDLGFTVTNRVKPDIFGDLGISLVGRLPKIAQRGCSDAVSG